MTMIWMRDEARTTERRAPLVPADAAKLIAQGFEITVEQSAKRIFDDNSYREAGCRMVPPMSWTTAPDDALILGVKELPAQPPRLKGRFCHFAHLYKDQRGWREEIGRFSGGGALYDIEYLTGGDGRRVAAFGYWAGWLGAAMGLWGMLDAAPRKGVATFDSREAVLGPIKAALANREVPRALVVGALGRSGTGACDMLEAVGISPTRWDKTETNPLDRDALHAHGLIVNCALSLGAGLRLFGPDDLVRPGSSVAMISDVACDPLSDFNPIPVYNAPTGWDAPFIDVSDRVALTAIDNLPSLLPREASEDFSAQLMPVLATYPDGVAWQNAARSFDEAIERV